MITVKKACELAKAEAEGLRVCSCVDIGDKYVFSFSAENGDLIPGTPVISVSKENGSLGYINIPPLENLKLLQAGKEIEFE